MECPECFANFDLGLHKPIIFCCRSLCYSCTYRNWQERSLICPKHNRLVDMNKLKPDLSKLDVLIKFNNSIKIPVQKKPESSVSIKKCDLCHQVNRLASWKKLKNGLCIHCEPAFQAYITTVSSFKCLNSHKFIELSINSPHFTQKCLLCQRNPGDFSQCFKCSLHICYNCSTKLTLTLQNLKFISCSCGQQLVWRPYQSSKQCADCKKPTKNFGVATCGRCRLKYCLACIFKLFDGISCSICSFEFNNDRKPYSLGCKHLYCEDCLSFSFDGTGRIYSCKFDKFNFKSLQEIGYDELLMQLIRISCKGNHGFFNQVNIRGNCEICKKGNRDILWLCEKCEIQACLACKQWMDYSELITSFANRCIHKHFMRKTPLPFLAYDQTENLSCKACGSNISDEAIHCRTCSISYCLNCTCILEGLIEKKSVTRCFCSESLKWSFTTVCKICSQCRNKFTESGSFSCGACGKVFCIKCTYLMQSMKCCMCPRLYKDNITSWHLNSCGHSFCKACIGEKLSPKFPCCPIDEVEIRLNETEEISHFTGEIEENSMKKKMEVCEFHVFTKEISCGFECDVCENCRGRLWACELCNYLACSKCKDWYESSESISETAFRCFKGHVLRETHNVEQFYNRKGKFLCDGCDKKTSGKSAHCHSCMADYCQSCISSIQLLIAYFSSISCTCEGTIIWKSNIRCSHCSSCKGDFSKSGSFLCTKCWGKFCITCAKKVKKVSCSLCNRSFLSEFLAPVKLSCSHCVCINCIEQLSLKETGLCPIDYISSRDVFSMKSLKDFQEGSKCPPHNFIERFNAREHCEICKKLNCSLYNCLQCNEIVCSTCKDWENCTDAVEEPWIRCLNAHNLRVFINNANQLLCSACGNCSIGRLSACKKCEVCVCAQCINILTRVLEKIELITCLCGYKIVWRFDKMCKKCGGCQRSFKDFGSFLCFACSKSWCLSCIFTARTSRRLLQ